MDLPENEAKLEKEADEKKKDLIFSLQIPKIKIQIDEAEENIQKEEELSKRLGPLAEYLSYNQKKIPFIEFFLINLLHFKSQELEG